MPRCQIMSEEQSPILAATFHPAYLISFLHLLLRSTVCQPYLNLTTLHIFSGTVEKSSRLDCLYSAICPVSQNSVLINLTVEYCWKDHFTHFPRWQRQQFAGKLDKFANICCQYSSRCFIQKKKLKLVDVSLSYSKNKMSHFIHINCTQSFSFYQRSEWCRCSV